jgi:chromosome partitioning protein
MKGICIAVFNQKGGVSKTTTAINLSAALAEKGKKVLVIDDDPQANTTNGLGVDDDNLQASIYNLLHNQCKLEDIIIHTQYGVDLIPADISLSNAEITLANVMSRETILNRILRPYVKLYDYIILDCPPSLGLLSINALVAADYLIIPVSPAYFSIKGIKHLLGTVNLVRDNLKPELKIMGVIITKFDSRVNLSKDIRTELINVFGDQVFKTVIRKNSQIEYAQDKQKPISYFDRACNGCIDYFKLADEVISYVGK